MGSAASLYRKVPGLHKPRRKKDEENAATVRIASAAEDVVSQAGAGASGVAARVVAVLKRIFEELPEGDAERLEYLQAVHGESIAPLAREIEGFKRKLEAGITEATQMLSSVRPTLDEATATADMKLVGTETMHLDGFAREIVSDLQRIGGEEVKQLVWTLRAPFEQAPWELYPDDVVLYRSGKLDEYVEEALKHSVLGKGMGMTQRELFQMIHEGCPGVGIWIKGGFVRDAVQGKPGKDIDLSLVCSRDGVKAMAELARERGWTHSCQTPNQEKWCSCAGKGGEGWSYLKCSCAKRPTWDYVRFGDKEKRDIEGVQMRNAFLGELGEGRWGCAQDFACNALLYSLEHKAIVDLTGGAGVEDAMLKRLRAPAYRNLQRDDPAHNEAWQLQKWMDQGEPFLVYRHLKFRARSYSPERVELMAVVANLLQRLLLQESFVDLFQSLPWRAGGTEEFRAWGGILTKDVQQMSSPYQVGDIITLTQVQEKKTECKVQSLLGTGATATVFKVMTTGHMARALKVFKAESSLEKLCREASLMLASSHPDSHPNVLRVDFVWYEPLRNEVFFLLELVDGGNLKSWIDDGRLHAGTFEEQQDRLAAIAYQLTCGLRYLHRLGILHTDVKPANVLMDKKGKPVLADFGVASQGTLEEGIVRATLQGCTRAYASPHARQLLLKVGSLPFPERKKYLEENPVTHRDDLFALGATIFDMFAKPGWQNGQSVAEVLASSSLAELVEDGSLLGVALQEGMLEVLRACFSADESLTADSIVELTTMLCAHSSPSTVNGLAAGRYANIRNNLAVALFDSGKLRQAAGKKDEAMRCFNAAHSQLERAIAAHPTDTRTLNNLGVINDARTSGPHHAKATLSMALSQSSIAWG